MARVVIETGPGRLLVEWDGIDLARVHEHVGLALEHVEADELVAPAPVVEAPRAVVKAPTPPVKKPPAGKAAGKPQAKADRTCEECGATFTPKRADSTVCSPACMERRSKRRAKEKTAPPKPTLVPPAAAREPVRLPVKTTTCVDCRRDFTPAHASQTRCRSCALEAS